MKYIQLRARRVQKVDKQAIAETCMLYPGKSAWRKC